MMINRFLSPVAVLALILSLAACSSNNGFTDLDDFIKEVEEKPIGSVEPIPEVTIYEAFTYGAASRRAPFTAPVEVVISDVEVEKGSSDIQPDENRPKELLENFALSQLRMVGTLQKKPTDPLLALIEDSEGGIHMVKTSQYMGKNHGRVAKIADGKVDLIEIVPDGQDGWLERPRSISLND